jgi:hypothetical protein
VPFFPLTPWSAAAQLWQTGQAADSQHTPSVQWPVAHSRQLLDLQSPPAPTLHALPSALRGAHMPPAAQ